MRRTFGEKFRALARPIGLDDHVHVGSRKELNKVVGDEVVRLDADDGTMMYSGITSACSSS